MADGAIYQAANRFRRELAEMGELASGALAEAYRPVLARARELADSLRLEMLAASAKGETLGASWLFRQARYQALIEGILGDLIDYGRQATGIAINAQLDALAVSYPHTLELFARGWNQSASLAASFVHPPLEAVRELVGFASDGSPLSDLFDALPHLGGREVRNKLIEGLSLGLHPSVVAREIRSAMGMPLIRAMTIARTEMMRSYREATSQTYIENRGVLDGWYWLASLSSRTCMACLAMHGTFHPIEERLESHPRCRCTQVPATKPWRELGGGSREQRESGEHSPPPSSERWFQALSVKEQRSIMGAGVHGLYQSGQVQWSELAKETFSEQWGRSVVPTPLSELRKRRGGPT